MKAAIIPFSYARARGKLLKNCKFRFLGIALFFYICYYVARLVCDDAEGGLHTARNAVLGKGISAEYVRYINRAQKGLRHRVLPSHAAGRNSPGFLRQ